jgi:predicted ATPase
MADGVAVRDGAEVPLTTKERDVLHYLATRAGRVVSREALLVDVWEYDPATVTRAVDMVVARLRRKIELNPARPDHVLTVTGTGYRFVLEMSEVPDDVGARTNITPGLSSFVGRAADLAPLDERVRGCGLVTVMGPPGVGKTRLALEYGHSSVDRYRGGVWFCGLADARDGDELRAVVAGALGAESDEVGRVLAQMGPTLLILDNFEQLVEVAPEVLGAWRSAAPQTTFLVTSRQRLGLEGEHTWRLRPLAPAAATRLLRDRADGHLVAGDEVLRALVDRLDRLPLAIELAAARLDLLSPSELLTRLSAPLSLLRSTRRDRVARQTTLEDAMAWSWDLLGPQEQALLADCTVFRGGFSLEAAEQVLDTEGRPSVLDGIHGLWDRSLLDVRTVDGGRRFGLLPSVAAFASARLDPAAARTVRTRHATYYLGHAEALRTRYRHGENDLVTAMERERENYFAACTGQASDAPRLVRMVWCLRPLLNRRGPQAKWLALCDDAVRVSRADDHLPTLAAALCERAHARGARGDRDGQERDCREALSLEGVSREVSVEALILLAQRQTMRGDLEGALASNLRGLSLADDPALRAGCHRALGLGLLRLGRFDEANQHLDRGAARYWEAKDALGVLRVREVQGLGMVLRGELERARGLFTRCAAGWESAGHGVQALVSHGELAGIALELGAIDEARGHLDVVERWIEHLGHLHQLPDLCMHRGLAHHLEGDLTRAREDYVRGLRVNADVRDQEFELKLAALLAIVEATDGDFEAAAWALERAHAAAGAMAFPIAPLIARVADTFVALTSGSLDADAAAQCIAAARAAPPGKAAPALRKVLRFLVDAVRMSPDSSSAPGH